MQIIGSGMAGLLTANILRRFNPEVLEAQPFLPNNHAALLRFRTDACAKATGVAFRKVSVQKAISFGGELYSTTSVAFNNMYSQKVTGSISDRSIVNLERGERFVAPENFIAQMAASAHIRVNSKLTKKDVAKRSEKSTPLISTIPMPVMMDLVGWKDKPKFEWRKIWSIRLVLQNCDVFQTIYYPGIGDEPYRASITGNLLMIECLTEPFEPKQVLSCVLKDFGVGVHPVDGMVVKEQEYGKLVPADEEKRRRFILYLTDRYRIYSLGRFATWRQILLDDVVKDVQVIERLIESRDGYQRSLIK